MEQSSHLLWDWYLRAGHWAALYSVSISLFSTWQLTHCPLCVGSPCILASPPQFPHIVNLPSPAGGGGGFLPFDRLHCLSFRAQLNGYVFMGAFTDLPDLSLTLFSFLALSIFYLGRSHYMFICSRSLPHPPTTPKLQVP